MGSYQYEIVKSFAMCDKAWLPGGKALFPYISILEISNYISFEPTEQS